jgi:hypothetical protein
LNAILAGEAGSPLSHSLLPKLLALRVSKDLGDFVRLRRKEFDPVAVKRNWRDALQIFQIFEDGLELELRQKMTLESVKSLAGHQHSITGWAQAMYCELQSGMWNQRSGKARVRGVYLGS